MNFVCATTIFVVILFVNLQQTCGQRIIYHSHDQFASKNLNHNEKTVKVTLFYETLCPYSVDYIKDQLYPTNEKLANYLNLDLVPYGGAKKTINEDGSYSFECHHGEVECLGNKIHACALEKYNSNTQTQIVRFFNCLAKSSYKSEEIQKCCNENSIDYKSIKSCLSSSKADNLLAAYGERQKQNKPKITFVPFVMFNGHYNATLNESDLMEIVCDLLVNKPDACSIYV